MKSLIERIKRSEEDNYRREALEEFKNIDNESREEGFELCSREAKEFARRLFNRIFERYPFPYTIYPTAEREVAISVRGKPGHSVLILCDSDDEVLCIANRGGKSKYVCYSRSYLADTDTFIEQALEALEF